ncbi:GcrA family cell cycle regulator [Aquamicrobium sp.]|uniref:GcrA family cell cycle regulator n=1 Tax=Aquamicrobium sp. TaxID=1872579 RepID=UPI002585911F|nr:GcrA family cell cycle regulator [Aquamicrobium sp.]MCK9549185.1 GcrA family cell cycle regulator [Aquamicrobium sp.]
MRFDFWTNDKIEHLKKLHFAGLSASKIASRIGTTRSAVIGKIHRLGIQRGTWATKAAARERVRRQSKPRQKRREVKMKPNPLIELLALPLPEEPKDEIARTTIVDREKDQCAWIIGPSNEMKCCGAPIVPGLSSPYCIDHARRAYSLPAVERKELILQDMQQAIARKQAREAGELQDAEKEKEAA